MPNLAQSKSDSSEEHASKRYRSHAACQTRMEVNDPKAFYVQRRSSCLHFMTLSHEGHLPPAIDATRPVRLYYSQLICWAAQLCRSFFGYLTVLFKAASLAVFLQVIFA